MSAAIEFSNRDSFQNRKRQVILVKRIRLSNDGIRLSLAGWVVHVSLSARLAKKGSSREVETRSTLLELCGRHLACLGGLEQF